jgi:pilus assembly protein Flp/PilA
LSHLPFWGEHVKYKQIQEAFLENPEERRFTPMYFAPKEKGQGLVEYALILVLVAIVVIAALMVLGPIIGNVFSEINSSLSGV